MQLLFFLIEFKVIIIIGLSICFEFKIESKEIAQKKERETTTIALWIITLKSVRNDGLK